MVIRLYCVNNHLKRIEENDKSQYTITILPSFLIPCSIVLREQVIKSTDEYVKNKNKKKSQLEIAMEMNLENAKSFNLFYLRIKKRINKWIVLLSEIIISIGGSIANDRMDETQKYNNSIKSNPTFRK